MTTEELKKKKAQSLKALEKYEKLKQEVKDNCHHPEEETISRERYWEGSYNDRAHTVYWNECMICGVRSEETVKQHSWYG